ncbi:Myosin-IXb [Heterocephalus glaber]|uniref:Myosin-IXb n=1 Tax=Heterocephalus glaber TaxID=10181 RepID=G5C2W7_HETGA|nr:Myosin-IXb [Heterocephalus glaber]
MPRPSGTRKWVRAGERGSGWAERGGGWRVSERGPPTRIGGAQRGGLGPGLWHLCEETRRSCVVPAPFDTGDLCSVVPTADLGPALGPGGEEEASVGLDSFSAALHSQPPGRPRSVCELEVLKKAFGNAKTAHNNNSSRFGKFIQVNYLESGIVRGNYHVFYYLLLGVSEGERQEFQLKQPEDYFYLNQHNLKIEDGEDLKHDFERLKQAMEMVGFLPATKRQIFSVLSAILYLGNVTYKKRATGRDEGLEVGPTEVLDTLSQLLKPLCTWDPGQCVNTASVVTCCSAPGVGWEPVALRVQGAAQVPAQPVGPSVQGPWPWHLRLAVRWRAHASPPVSVTSTLAQVKREILVEVLTKRKTVTANDKLILPYSLGEAVTARDSMAKSLYSALFDWIVLRINHALLNKKDMEEAVSCLSIGVLDIFGFEDFERNSFEQFCINYANEQLQYYFNQHIFKLEQEEYQSEGITWHNIAYTDNVGCIHLISKKPTGLFYLLDEESNFPHATSQTLLAKFKQQHEDNKYFLGTPVKEPAFIIQHFAGRVKYQIKDFREKNMDYMRPDIVALLRGSDSSYVRELIGMEPVAVFRWAVLRAALRAMAVLREAARVRAEKREQAAGMDGPGAQGQPRVLPAGAHTPSEKLYRDLHHQMIESIKGLPWQGEDPRRLLQSLGRLQQPRTCVLVLGWVCLGGAGWCPELERITGQGLGRLQGSRSQPAGRLQRHRPRASQGGRPPLPSSVHSHSAEVCGVHACVSVRDSRTERVPP